MLKKANVKFLEIKRLLKIKFVTVIKEKIDTLLLVILVINYKRVKFNITFMLKEHRSYC